MGARQYDPYLGRFIETDPVEGGSCNDYDYVCMNPMNGSDLDGQICWSCPFKAAHRKISRTIRGKRGGFTLRGTLRGLSTATALVAAVALAAGTGGASLALYAGLASAFYSGSAYVVARSQGKCRGRRGRSECAADVAGMFPIGGRGRFGGATAWAWSSAGAPFAGNVFGRARRSRRTRYRGTYRPCYGPREAGGNC
jgi:hypothetical protein